MTPLGDFIVKSLHINVGVSFFDIDWTILLFLSQKKDSQHSFDPIFFHLSSAESVLDVILSMPGSALQTKYSRAQPGPNI